jgi:hypothetical protein
MDERELVALLYRADWTSLSLSGQVGTGESATTMLVAPGKRYREESLGGQHVEGCDGERAWRWRADSAPDHEVHYHGGPRPPFPALLAPSWLLAGYVLTIEGAHEVCGRAGVLVSAISRRPGWARDRVWSYVVPPFRFGDQFQYDSVTAVVDAELGILLRCSCAKDGEAPSLTEFARLTVGLDDDEVSARFTAPPGSVFYERGLHGATSSGHVSWAIPKTVAGLAAGGLGAAIKYAPSVRGAFGSSPPTWQRATDESDPDAEMPRDEPVPESGAGPAGTSGMSGTSGASGPAGSAGSVVGDEVLHLIYRSGGAEPASFTGTLHSWFDGTALLSAVPESARKVGFGGVGLLVDALSESAPGTVHEVYDIRMGGPDRYRIDLVPAASSWDTGGRERRNRRHQRLTVACDGERRWQVYSGKVVVGPAGPPPGELSDLLDPSWLLWCELSGGEEIVVGGRRAYRVTVTKTDRAEPSVFGGLFGLFFPAVAVVDAETGRLIRVTVFKGGKPATRYELRDVRPLVPGASEDFTFEAPEGLPVEEEQADPDPPPAGEASDDESWEPREHSVVNPVEIAAKAAAEAIKKRADEKVAAVRDFLDSLRSPKPPRD